MGTCAAGWRVLRAVAVAAVIAAGPVAAQRIEVRAVNDNGPLPGAMVVVEDPAGAAVIRVLANVAGLVRADVPAGRYRVRVLAIGHAPAVSELVSAMAGEVTVVRLALVPRPLMIDEIVVNADPVCGREVAGGAQLARLWDEARKNLEATALSRVAGEGRFEVNTFERDLTPADVVIRESRSARQGMVKQPFVADAAAIERGGYVHRSGDDNIYYAPDEPLLLSDHFLATHCFSVTRDGADPALVGLRFVPAPGRRVPDIAGVLWLRRQTAELTLLEYSYTSVRLPRNAKGVGGQIRFARLPTGVAVVADWSIRMPRVVTIQGRRGTRDSLAGYHEVGGVASLGAPLGDPEQSTVVGRVVDSIGWAGLAGVEVSISDGAYAATTDESGAFRLAVPLQGHLRVTFSHPRLDQLQLTPLYRAVAVVRGEQSRIEVWLPSASTMLARMCPGDSLPAGRSLILGRLVGRSGQPVVAAAVRAMWDSVAVLRPRIRVQPVEATVRTGPRGEFTICAPHVRPVGIDAPEVRADAVVLGSRRDQVAFVTLRVR